MSTRISGRSVAARKVDGSAVNSKKDRSSLCTFTFADGRRCRSPRHSSTSSFCFFHARKEAQARAAEDLGHDISYFFSGHYLSACDLSIALGRVFAATAQGQIKRKTAATLAFLGQVLVQSIRIAEHEYCNAFEPDAWRAAVRRSVDSNFNYPDDPADADPSQPAAPPAPETPPPANPSCRDADQPEQVSPPSSSAVSAEASPSVEAGLQPGSFPQPATPSAPRPFPQTAPPQSPAPPPPLEPTAASPTLQKSLPHATTPPHTPASDPQTQTLPAPPTNLVTSDPAPAPASAPPPQPIAAHQLPGFGAPAWDVLMPAKPVPRRRRRVIPSGLLPI